VLHSPVGETSSVPFAVPFSDLELENFLLRIGRPRRNLRRIDAPQTVTIKTFGGRLFDSLFRDDLRVNLQSSLSRAESQDAGLRIRLRLSDCPELADLPWEYLYDRVRNRFFCLSRYTPLIRYLELPEPVRVVSIAPLLRVLVVIANPSDYPELDVKQELAKLEEAVGDLGQAGRVTVEPLQAATLPALHKRLRRADYHVFHFIGHGGFDDQAQDGLLVLEDQFGRGRKVHGQDLGALLHDHRSLCLAVLNACEGARSDRTDPFAGTAQSLVQQGIPAVVAMQFEITDEAAITFAHVLYETIADGYPLDAAVAEGRRAIHAAGNDVEWGTPVLYLRAPDGRIFSVLPPEAVEEATPRVEEPGSPAEEPTRPEQEQAAPQPEEHGAVPGAVPAQPEAEAPEAEPGAKGEAEPPDALVEPEEQTLNGVGPTAPARETLPPKLELSATLVDFGRLSWHAESPRRTVRLENSGGGTLDARAETSASWLQLGQVDDEFVISVDTTVAGEHEGDIEVQSGGGSATIHVHVLVDSKPPGPWRRLGPLLAVVFGLSAIVVWVIRDAGRTDTPAATTVSTQTATTVSTQTTRPTITTRFKVDGESLVGTQVFEDRFSTTSARWDKLDDAKRTQRYRDGAYEITAKQGGDYVGLPRARGDLSSLRNVVVGVDARRVSRDDPGGDPNGYGIACRQKDPRNYYWFNITNAGWYSINKRMDGKQIRLQWPTPTTGIISAKKMNHIQVMCSQEKDGPTRLVLWVNGRQLVDVMDRDRPLGPGGGIGLYGHNAGTGPSTCTFDNFTVWKI
jgi:hypothetical protein